MKKNIQKIIGLFFGLAFAFIAQTSFAAVSWNTASNDCAGLRIANFSTNQGYGSCWSLSSVSASAGDKINVRLYYHNTGDTTATNVRLILNTNNINSASRTHNFSGRIESDQGGINLGSVSLNLNSDQSLEYYSTVWYPNQTENGQNKGSEVMSSGANIGSISPGWSSQGTVVVVFNVRSSQSCPTGQTWNGSSCVVNTSCPTGQTWNGSSCVINTTCPPGSTWNGSSCVVNTSCPTGQTWNGSSCVVNTSCPTGQTWNGSSCVVNTSCPTGSTWNGTSCVINTTCPPGSIWNGSTCIWDIAKMFGNITAATPQCYIPAGEDSCPILFTWRTERPMGISAVTADGYGVVAEGNNDSDIFQIPFGKIKFRLYNNAMELDTENVTAFCATGSTWNGEICSNGYVYQNTCSISNFDINGSSSTQVSSGSSATLNWSTNNCSYVTISNTSNGGTLNTSGNQTVFPNGDTTYTLRAYGTNGAVYTRTVNAYVNQQQNNCTISNFNANPTVITQGGSTYLSWNTNNCNSVTLSNSNGSSLGNFQTNSGQTVTPGNSTSYTLRAFGNNGNDSRTIYVTVGTNVVNNNCVATNMATSISSTGVQFNGALVGANSSSTYFEYGTTVSFGRQTSFRPTYGTNSFSEVVSNLSPNTLYFYRLVSNCGSGQVFGQTQSFQTSSVSIVNRIIQTFIPQRTVEIRQNESVFVNTVGTISPIMLEITNKYEAFGEGDIVEYTVKYRNIGNTVLIKPLLQIIVPSGIVISNTSMNGSYVQKDNIISFQLTDIYPGAEGIVYAQGTVVNMPNNDGKIVSKALLIYTTQNNTQENAIAYVTNVPKNFNNSTLGAAAFFGGLFSIGFLGWLLILILLLLIILLVRSYYFQRNGSFFVRPNNDQNHNHNNNLNNNSTTNASSYNQNNSNREY